MLVSIFSDLHIHNYRKFDVDNSRLRNCLSVLDDIFKFNDKNGIKNTLFVGDLYDNQKMLPSIVVNETVAKLKELFETYPNQRIVAITGNHDQATKNLIDDEAVSALEHLATVFERRFILIDNQSVKMGDCVVTGIPYYEYPEHFKAKLSELSVVNEQFKEEGLNTLLLVHQTPTGLGNPNIPVDTDVNDPLYDPFDFVLCGHIHERQHIIDKFLIVGSPLHRDLGDEGQDKGFIVMDLDNLSEGFKFISLKGRYPEFVRVKVGIGEEPEPDDFNYVVPDIIVEELPNVDDVSTEDFGSDLKAETLLKNYWEAVDGKNEKLLEVGLKLVK